MANIIGPVVNNLSGLLVNEANFLLDVKGEVEYIRNELGSIYQLLEDSERNRDQHNNRVYVEQFRNVAYVAEDIIDKYVVYLTKEKRRNLLMQTVRIGNKAVTLHKIGEKIKQVRITIDQIKRNRNDYNPNTSVSEEDEYHRDRDRVQQSRLEVEEDNVVGFTKETGALVNRLVREAQDQWEVIAISGMAGLGKTTLAKKVYKHDDVQAHFPATSQVWVNVSEKFRLRDLLVEILKSVLQTRRNFSKKTVKELKQMVTNHLSSSEKYLVVLDDIWRKEDWDDLENVFPKSRNGSRVLITTRNKKVARVSENPVQLGFLNNDDGLKLLSMKACGQMDCPPELKENGEKIVDMCGRLPLAIKEIGKTLANQERSPFNWGNMVKQAKWNLKSETLFFHILGLSYHCLRPHLKPCFLYLGIFPREHKIPTRQLIQLWISEGFIQDEDSEASKEDIARKYLQDLIDWNLVRVEKVRSDDGVKTCYVHDLVHDLCLQLSEDKKFLMSYSRVSPRQNNEPRRLSIHCSCREYISQAKRSNVCQNRTLLCFNQDGDELSCKEWKKLFKYMKLLRVLDLGDKEVQRFPKAVEKLILSRYLSLKIVDAAAISSSIFALDNLQTLDLRKSQIGVLPKGIWNMGQLRHLYLDGHTRLPENTDNKFLYNLQTLCYISVDLTKRVDIVERAPNLRKLGLYGYHCRSSDEQRNSTFRLRQLECLKFANECTFDESIVLPSTSTVTKISIKQMAILSPTTIMKLQSLSNLQILKFDRLFSKELVFQGGWFPVLQLLKIENSRIERWELRQGAVRNLRLLVINNCPRLSKVSPELQNLATLEKIELLQVSKVLTNNIRKLVRNTVNIVTNNAS